MRGRISSAVTACTDIDDAKCLAFCGPNPVAISARCTSRALKSLTTTNAPIASSASAGAALKSGARNTNPSSNS